MAILFKNIIEQRAYLDRVRKKIYPTFKTGGVYYRTMISKNLKPFSIVIDAGCGDGGMIANFKNNFKQLIGVDRSKDLLKKNGIVDQRIFADLAEIPLPDNFADMVVSEFVLEHLEYPDRVFKEVCRILKPDGVFIFITPNKLNPIIALSKVLPHFVHDWFRNRILKKGEETHRTYYRANSRGSLESLLSEAGFRLQNLDRAGNPEYLGVLPALMWLAVAFERMIDNRLLSRFKMYLIGEFRKK